jgi:hypothetical protein
MNRCWHQLLARPAVAVLLALWLVAVPAHAVDGGAAAGSAATAPPCDVVGEGTIPATAGVVCGGPGDDTFTVPPDAVVTVVGGGGTDTVVVTGTAGHDLVVATPTEVIGYDGATVHATLEGIATVQVLGGDGDDSLDARAGPDTTFTLDGGTGYDGAGYDVRAGRILSRDLTAILGEGVGPVALQGIETTGGSFGPILFGTPGDDAIAVTSALAPRLAIMALEGSDTITVGPSDVANAMWVVGGIVAQADPGTDRLVLVGTEGRDLWRFGIPGCARSACPPAVTRDDEVVTYEGIEDVLVEGGAARDVMEVVSFMFHGSITGTTVSVVPWAPVRTTSVENLVLQDIDGWEVGGIGDALDYWLVGADGGVLSFGDAPFLGSAGALALNQPVVGMTPTPAGRGYWLVARDGGIFGYGDAAFHGSTGAMVLNQPVVGMAPTPMGRGYWLVARDGGIFAFGDARFHGSLGDRTLNAPIVGMAATPSGLGYWLVARDGGIFAFGDARFFGSAGGQALDAPVVAMAASPTGRGYHLVTSAGEVLAFGDAVARGSLADSSQHPSVVGVATTPAGSGYWLATDEGIVHPYGAAGVSSLAPPVAAPIVGIVAAP